MPAYDRTRFDPPAPLASGADVTLLPVDVLDRLELTPIPGTQYELTGFDGGSSLASVVRLELVFCGRTFRGQFALIDQPWGILGRNVLNAVSLLLDGPALTWAEAAHDRPRQSP